MSNRRGGGYGGGNYGGGNYGGGGYGQGGGGRGRQNQQQGGYRDNRDNNNYNRNNNRNDYQNRDYQSSGGRSNYQGGGGRSKGNYGSNRYQALSGGGGGRDGGQQGRRSGQQDGAGSFQDIVRFDLRPGELPAWELTCYGHTREGPNDIEGDTSFEEVRWAQLSSGCSAQQLISEFNTATEAKQGQWRFIQRQDRPPSVSGRRIELRVKGSMPSFWAQGGAETLGGSAPAGGMFGMSTAPQLPGSTGFGGSSGFGRSTSTAPQLTGSTGFGGSSGFGSSTSTAPQLTGSTGFGGSSGFGSSTFGSAGLTGSSPSAFGAGLPAGTFRQAAGAFGQAASGGQAAGAFGQPASGFGFGVSAMTPEPPQPPQASTTFGTFGASIAQSTGSVFGSPQPASGGFAAFQSPPALTPTAPPFNATTHFGAAPATPAAPTMQNMLGTLPFAASSGPPVQPTTTPDATHAQHDTLWTAPRFERGKIPEAPPPAVFCT